MKKLIIVFLAVMATVVIVYSVGYSTVHLEKQKSEDVPCLIQPSSEPEKKLTTAQKYAQKYDQGGNPSLYYNGVVFDFEFFWWKQNNAMLDSAMEYKQAKNNPC